MPSDHPDMKVGSRYNDQDVPLERLQQQVVRLAEFKTNGAGQRRIGLPEVYVQDDGEEEKSLGQILMEEIEEQQKQLNNEEEAKLFEKSQLTVDIIPAMPGSRNAGKTLRSNYNNIDSELSSENLFSTACSTPDLS